MSTAAGGDFQAQRLALVCEDDASRQSIMKAALEQIGFTMQAPKNAADAIERMRRDTYEIVIINESYQHSTPLDNPVLTAIRQMPMMIRRYMFVAAVGRDYKTFDNMMAFAKSVNAVVNVNDLPHLPAILVKAVNENNQFYRVLREVLVAAGRR